jgi:hypothetical protein
VRRPQSTNFRGLPGTEFPCRCPYNGPVIQKRKWGKWILNFDGPPSLDYGGATWRYEIVLSRVTNASDMLDWIFQLREKTWMTPQDMADLLEAFDDIFAPQGNLVGADKSISPKFLAELLK